MPFKRRPRTHDITQYHRAIPVDTADDLIKVTMSGGEVLYVTLEGSTSWKLDAELVPDNLKAYLETLGARSISVKRCCVGFKMQLVYDCNFYRQNGEFTTGGIVTNIRPVKRSARVKPGTSVRGKLSQWMDSKH